MKLFSSFLALSVSVLPAVLVPSGVFSQSSSNYPIVGIWQGYATVGAQQVAVAIRISRSGSNLRVEFLNHP
jgi:hypothetical protein